MIYSLHTLLQNNRFNCSDAQVCCEVVCDLSTDAKIAAHDIAEKHEELLLHSRWHLRRLSGRLYQGNVVIKKKREEKYCDL